MSEETDHDHHHPHPPQPDHREPTSYHELMGLALDELLQEKGIYSADELRAKIEAIQAVDAKTHGAKVVARAWVDAEFRAALLDDATKAVASLGLDPGYTDLMALENKPDLHNVVVCTLCSCYPRALLGLPPAWYKSAEYRSRVVREPRTVLAEFGTTIAEGCEVRVHDSTAELRYIVVPTRPAGTENWSEAKLAGLVTRDCMIGVSQPKIEA